MINAAIFRKAIFDSWLSTFFSCVGLIGFTLVFVWAMENMGAELLDFVSRFPFVQKIFEMSLGIDVSGSVSLEVLFSVVFTHGIVLLLSWSTIISMATRVTVAEMESGTADLLYTLPVSRPEVFRSITMANICVCVLLSYCPSLGIWLGSVVYEMEPIQIYPFFIAATNFLFLNLAVTSLGLMLGCILNRRSLAVGLVVALVFVSSAMTFLEPFVDQLKQVRWLSLLGYMRPVDVVRSGEWPLREIAGLSVISVVCWMIGLVTLIRKDIPTA